MNTVIEAVAERMIARPCVIQEFSAVVYCTEAMAAAVIGNVYAHHDIENLIPRKKLMRTTREE